MDLNSIKESIVTNVYYISSSTKVPLHEHEKHDEIFYCIKGSGFGVLENEVVELHAGKAFIVPARTKHSLKTEGDLYVTTFLVPVVSEMM